MAKVLNPNGLKADESFTYLDDEIHGPSYLVKKAGRLILMPRMIEEGTSGLIDVTDK